MMSPLRIVSPYRPFPPASDEHKALGFFDWVGALEMLEHSVKVCSPERTQFYALTDFETKLPASMSAARFKASEHTLMLWIVEIALRYLESEHFDRDTVMISPDSLLFHDLRLWFAGDFGIVVRPHHRDRPILNAVQFWPLRSRDVCVAIYKRALRIARELPEPLLTWGADSEPFRQLLWPIVGGLARRHGWYINFIQEREIMEPLSKAIIDDLEAGNPVCPKRPIVDFRYLRKQHMRAYFEATIGAIR